MEAILTARETVMTYVWDKFFGHVSANEWEKAEGCFGYYCRLEELTDEQYDSMCQCDKSDCYCTE